MMSNTGESENLSNLFNLKAFVDDLKCSICLEIFKNPRTLSCQHSYCTSCLEKLVPLQSSKIQCPQCRSVTTCHNLQNIPKNTLIINLINNLQNTKATCPMCKNLKALIICEHCSSLFCKKCKNAHVKSSIENLETKFKNLANLSSKVDLIKSNIRKNEHETLANVLEKMNQLQNELMSLWQARKLSFIEQINRFYEAKIKNLESASEHLTNLETNLNELQEELKTCKQNLNCDTDEMVTIASNNEIKLIKSLNDLEKKYNAIEQKMNSSMPKMDLDNNKLDLVYNEIDTFDIYKKIIDKVYLETSNNDKILLDNAKLNENLNRFKIEVKNIFNEPISFKSPSQADENESKNRKIINFGESQSNNKHKWNYDESDNSSVYNPDINSSFNFSALRYNPSKHNWTQTCFSKNRIKNLGESGKSPFSYRNTNILTGTNDSNKRLNN